MTGKRQIEVKVIKPNGPELGGLEKSRPTCIVRNTFVLKRTLTV